MKRYLLAVFMWALHLNGWATPPSLPIVVPSSAVPPAVKLHYAFQLKQGLVSASGDSDIIWSVSQTDYKVSTLSHVAIIGSVLNVTSEGKLSPLGLQTRHFYEKSFLKKPQTLTIDDDRQAYTYQQGNQRFAMPSLAFDRANIVWQLSLYLNADSNWVQPQQQFTYNIVERNGITPWHFMVIGTEQLDTPLGTLTTYHIKRLANKRQQTIDIWFAKDHNAYPVQIFFNEIDGSYFKQTIRQITPQ